MKFLRYIIIAALTGLLLFRCDVIGEADREIKMEQIVIEKNVLLVDFTDQLCLNCPSASAEIEMLKERYGDTLIVVGMHSYFQPLPLVTADGNTYNSHFGIVGHPTGVIDGLHKADAYQQWGGIIHSLLDVEAPVEIDLSCTFDDESKELSITTKIINKEIRDISNSKMQLWVIENNVRGFQLLVDGTRVTDYNHNHVFRAAINGTWGENISFGDEREVTFNNSYTLNANWKPEDIHIVGFVYDANSNEVYETVEINMQ